MYPVAQKPKAKCRHPMLVVRLSEECKALVVQAAEREGLQISSFIIMLLVRLHILPESCLKKIKRRPVPFFNALHGLLGVVNKIGGNFKQLALVYPDMGLLHETQSRVIGAAAAITDALQGKAVPESVNLYRLQGDITQTGHVFNQIVKSVNADKPSLSILPAVLQAIARNAVDITTALHGTHVEDHDAITERAMDVMRTNMRHASNGQSQRHEGHD